MEALPLSFFCRPAELVGPELVGCRLVKREESGSLRGGVVGETEASTQDIRLSWLPSPLSQQRNALR